MKKQSVFDQFYEEYDNYKTRKEQILEDSSAIQALAEAHDITENQVKEIIKQGIIKKAKKAQVMKKNIIIGSIAILSIVLISFIMSISYGNKQVEIYNKATAQQKVCEMYFDKMFKVLKQKAKVSSEYANNFKEIYVEIMEGRYSGGSKDGSLMKWIHESNPNFDASMYKDLMVSIEHERNAFFEEQKVLTDLEMTYKNLLETAPSSWFTDANKKLDIITITSKYTKNVYETGEDNDLELFN